MYCNEGFVCANSRSESSCWNLERGRVSCGSVLANMWVQLRKTSRHSGSINPNGQGNWNRVVNNHWEPVTKTRNLSAGWGGVRPSLKE